MKTQILFKSIVLALILASTSTFAVAKTYNDTSFKVETNTDLRTTIRGIIENDFKSPDNFLQKNNISRLNDQVELKFYIDADKKIHIVEAESDNLEAAKYVERLLENYTLNVDNAFANKHFMLSLKVVYRS